MEHSSLSDANSADALRLLSALWPSSDRTHQLGIIHRKSKYYQNIAIDDSIEEAIKLANSISENGQDVYFACAEYINSQTRTANNADCASAFWMDFDCGEDKALAGKGYTNPETVIEVLNEFCDCLGLPKPTHIILSGGGIHSYWAITYPVARIVWQCSAKKLKALTSEYGLLVDDTRTADIASVLRIPGTLNYKYNPPKPVSLFSCADKSIDSSAMLTAIENAYSKMQKAKSTQNTPIDKVVTEFSSQGLGLGMSDIRYLLAEIDPDCNRTKWIKIGMAIYHESRGSEDGFDLWNGWSAAGQKYSGEKSTRVQWNSFKQVDVPVTLGTIIKMVKDTGKDPMDILAGSEQFEVCDHVVMAPSQEENKLEMVTNPLDKFSLRGMSAELEKNALNEVPILGQIALKGQYTILYAAPNTGKTLLTIHLIIKAINQGNIEPSRLYYLNMDDNGKGLLEKSRLAEEYGFHMLSEGYLDFQVNNFLSIMLAMIKDDQCRDVVIVLDTLKKFINLMDKTQSSRFNSVIRQFITKGGSLIGLAHTNKNKGVDGKSIPAGTTDMIDDSDCAYTLSEITSNDNEKVVQFNNLKRRGNVVMDAAYSYTVEKDASYSQILLSVEEIDSEQINSAHKFETIKNDAEIIEAIKSKISDGVNTKMKLAESVAKSVGVSKRGVVKVIEKYTGDNADLHSWKYSVQERGAQVFCLLTNSTPSKNCKPEKLGDLDA